MKHVTFSDKSLLVGDEVAILLVEYATELGNQSKADNVTIRGFGADGDEVEATYVLNEAANLMTETVRTSMQEPDNGAAVQYLRERLGTLRHPPVASVDDRQDTELSDFDY